MRRNKYLVVLFVIFLCFLIISGCSEDTSPVKENENGFDAVEKFNEFLTWVNEEHTEIEISNDGNWEHDKEENTDWTRWRFFNNRNATNFYWEILIYLFKSSEYPVHIILIKKDINAVWLRVVETASGEFLEIFGGIEDIPKR